VINSKGMSNYGSGAAIPGEPSPRPTPLRGERDDGGQAVGEIGGFGIPV